MSKNISKFECKEYIPFGLKNIFLLIVIFSLNIKIKSFKFFKAFYILSNDLIIISDEGIIKYNINTGESNLLISSVFVEKNEQLDFLSIAQFPSDNGGYIVCRANVYIYLLSSDGSSIYGNITLSQINNTYAEIIPYITQNDKKTIIICYIDNNKIYLLMYEINLSSFEDSTIIYQNEINIVYEDNTIGYTYIKGMACKLMISQDMEEILTCFVPTNNNCINVLSFQQENNFDIKSIIKKDIGTSGLSFITIDDSPNKSQSLICYNEYGNYKCSLYNSIKQEWSSFAKYLSGCIVYEYDRGLKYISDRQEYIIYCNIAMNELIFVKLDEDYEIKDINDNKCQTKFTIPNCYTIYASSILYNNENDKYNLVVKCSYNNNEDFFRLNEIDESICSNVIEDIINLLFPSSSYPSSSLFTDKITISETTMISNSILDKADSTSEIINIFEQSTYQKITKFIQNLKYIYFYENGDITRGITNKTKEEIEEFLDDIISSIEIGKKYEIIGEDYNIRISPVNLIDTFDSTYVEFSLCEEILRKQYKISSDKILTILQIEIERVNTKALTNQVEYEIFDENKNLLNLSFCQDTLIKVNYQIKDQSLINQTKINEYSNIGVDIFNSNDDFFNDICYSYSNNNSDIILKDRILDIYENVSLCDNGCTYDKIDLESITVICSCVVKTNLNTNEEEPIFKDIVKDSFKDSNFGIIKCYNLVFSLDYKLRNIGFWIFLFFILFNIILFILYFINGIKYIIIFVNKEMRKNNYIARIEPCAPLKKKKRKECYHKSGKEAKKVKFENILININQLDDNYTSSHGDILKESIQRSRIRNSTNYIYKKKKKKQINL